MEITIFGAQAIALGAYQAFHSLYPNRKVRCFLVSHMENNASTLGGLPVLDLHRFGHSLSQDEKDDMQILIATPENVMDGIEKILEEYGFYHHTRLTASRWAQLMGYYYMCGKVFVPLPALPIGYHKPEIHMFMVKFYKDRPLTENYDIPEWITPIQAGAALCSERVAALLDYGGENISSKNGNYSELTVLYWIWKNCLTKDVSGNNGYSENRERAKTDNWRIKYYGLSHYRRILELTEDDILRLEDNKVDAVLPYPMPYEPNIGEHHKRYLTEGDWEALLTALEELQPEYANAIPYVMSQQYFYNYNIILARKEVLSDYCSWLFPLLERIEQLSVPKGWERKDRYIGYMGETLETLYFMYNRNKLVLVHTGCRFLI